MTRAEKVQVANIIADKIEGDAFMEDVLHLIGEKGIKLEGTDVFVSKVAQAVRTNFSKVIK